jgi:hypothetical protein
VFGAVGEAQAGEGGGDGLAGGVAAGELAELVVEDEAGEVGVAVGGEPDDRERGGGF